MFSITIQYNQEKRELCAFTSGQVRNKQIPVDGFWENSLKHRHQWEIRTRSCPATGTVKSKS